MSKYPVLDDFKVKIMSDDPDQVQQALDEISSLYKHISRSSVLRSSPHGYHAFISVYMRAELHREGY